MKNIILIILSQLLWKLGTKLERFGKKMFTIGLKINPHLKSNWEEVDALFAKIEYMQNNGPLIMETKNETVVCPSKTSP